MKGKYFNDEEDIGFPEVYGTLRMREAGEGFQVVQGGSYNKSGKHYQFSVIAYCETKEEAEELVKKLCSL